MLCTQKKYTYKGFYDCTVPVDQRHELMILVVWIRIIPRPSPSVSAYCKRLKTGTGKGPGMGLVKIRWCNLIAWIITVCSMR